MYIGGDIVDLIVTKERMSASIHRWLVPMYSIHRLLASIGPWFLRMMMISVVCLHMKGVIDEVYLVEPI